MYHLRGEMAGKGLVLNGGNLMGDGGVTILTMISTYINN